MLSDVLEQDIDVKKQERLDFIRELNIVKKSADNIIADLEKSFYNNNFKLEDNK